MSDLPTAEHAAMGTFALLAKLTEKMEKKGLLTNDERAEIVADAINALLAGPNKEQGRLAAEFIKQFYPVTG